MGIGEGSVVNREIRGNVVRKEKGVLGMGEVLGIRIRG